MLYGKINIYCYAFWFPIHSNTQWTLESLEVSIPVTWPGFLCTFAKAARGPQESAKVRGCQESGKHKGCRSAWWPLVRTGNLLECQVDDIVWVQNQDPQIISNYEIPHYLDHWIFKDFRVPEVDWTGSTTDSRGLFHQTHWLERHQDDQIATPRRHGQWYWVSTTCDVSWINDSDLCL